MVHDPTRQRSVGTDMERIFGSGQPANKAQELEDAPWASAQSPGPQRPQSRFLRPAVLAVLAVVVLALGSLALRGVRNRPPVHESHVSTPAPPTGRIATIATPTPVAKPVAKPVPEPVRIAEQAPVVVARERPVAVAERPKPERDPLPPPPRAVAPRSTGRPAAAEPLVHTDQKHRPPSRAVAEHVDSACDRGRADDACIYQGVVAADGRLRDAYADAVRDGAPPKKLAAIRRSWQKARDLSLAEPDETVRRFDSLTDELKHLNGTPPR